MRFTTKAIRLSTISIPGTATTWAHIKHRLPPITRTVSVRPMWTLGANAVAKNDKRG